ncbi:NUDIX hydrolase [Longispora fulva]|uniref:8-oxo-dGTP pyrophosphatase MutT (NUDIX family) n=1 Tax=Longispora fulva TaxID=619741 RepID=A0A8J7GXS2_9ACTN|nr:NUDIX hydrolase [Longispora fulva]MBG6141104.1 8-oxo-dGTP pyrophosphatase MutT (NUDIX family) [Longispora fulva]
MWDTAVVIVRDSAERVLLVHQNYGPRFFGLPGGKVEPGETLAQAAVREVLEETGLTVTVGDRVSVDDLVYPGGARFRAHAFVAESVEGVPSVPDRVEISTVQWYDLGELPSPLTPSAMAILPRLRAARHAGPGRGV